MSTSAAQSAFRRWLVSLRAYSFTASLTPVGLAVAVSVGNERQIVWWTLPLFALSALLFHAGTNVLNDYYDHLHGVDGPEDTDPTHAISRGIVTPEFMRFTGHLYFVLGIGVGLPIGLVRGWVFVLAGLLAAAGAFFYTNARFSFKYAALGDVLVFLLMGPALVVMGLWALSGHATWEGLLSALPIALLVTAILHGNNLRNLESDASAGIRTLAGILGRRGADVLFAGLMLSPYALLVVGVITPILPLPALVAFMTLPTAVRVTHTVFATRTVAPLEDLPVSCAKLHFQFGLLYVLGVLLAAVWEIGSWSVLGVATAPVSLWGT
ncbi:MAG: prenyltransferase [Spirochaetota bacterium]